MSKNQKATSITVLRKNAFAILNMEKDRHIGKSGGFVNNYKDIYHKLLSYKSTLTMPKPKLYFAKVDVKCCFDSINQDLLLNVLIKILKNENYKLIKYTTVSKVREKQFIKYEKKAYPADEIPQFPEIANTLAESLRDTVFVDGVTYQTKEYREVLRFLESHVKQNVIKGEDIYHQYEGIPQGSIISTLLCNFLFNDLEKNKLGLFSGSDGLLLRWVDDFLYITTEKNKAVQFLDVMCEGHPEYGCFINKEKSLANFDYDQVNKCQVEVPWCGLLIHSKTLNVKCDYSNYLHLAIRHQITIEFSQNQSLALRQRLTNWLRQNCHEVFMSVKLNSVYTARLNLYQIFLMAALRFREYVEELASNKVEMSHIFLANLIRDAFLHMNQLITLEDLFASAWERQVSWLGLHAFRRVFMARNNRRFKYLIEDLAKFMILLNLGGTLERTLCSVTDLNNSLVFKQLLRL
ncbi:8741_t:CDS:2 [Ambispora leptoticha]|uniref:Telomerase reverse transcriptase n=1 Tax=Ambispora leptoticha TaxID=144679 RepID=A0A9N9CES0_9GLOM|nr:8741_t:CDS:2 [Ambispora leptoticha]